MKNNTVKIHRIYKFLSFFFKKMNVLIDTLWFIREIDLAEEQLNDNRINKLGDIRDLGSEEFKNYYKPLDVVLKTY